MWVLFKKNLTKAYETTTGRLGMHPPPPHHPFRITLLTPSLGYKVRKNHRTMGRYSRHETVGAVSHLFSAICRGHQFHSMKTTIASKPILYDLISNLCDSFRYQHVHKPTILWDYCNQPFHDPVLKTVGL